MIAQRVEQRGARLDLNVSRLAVNIKRDPGVARERRRLFVLCIGFELEVVGDRSARAGDTYTFQKLAPSGVVFLVFTIVTRLRHRPFSSIMLVSVAINYHNQNLDSKRP